MDAKVVLAVPYRATPSRAAVWDDLRPRYEALPYALSVSDSDPAAPFNVSEARNRAVEAVGDSWDVVVQIDADTWIDPAALSHLIAQAASQRRAFYPEWHTYMKPDQVSVSHEYRHTAAGVVAYPRRVWDAVGGYDERFRGWGYEDTAMGLAVGVLTGALLYVPGMRIVAFSNEPGQDGAWAASHRRWADGAVPKLFGDYVVASRDPVAMARIVGEARAYREWWRGSPRHRYHAAGSQLQ